MVKRTLQAIGISGMILGGALIPGITSNVSARTAVNICHIDLTNGGFDVIAVNQTAVAGHIKHGDSVSYTSFPDGTCTPN